MSIKAYIKRNDSIVKVSEIDFNRELVYWEDVDGINLAELNDVKLLAGSGLLDINGNEIYEGDILLRKNENIESVYVVVKGPNSNNLFLKKLDTGSIFNIELLNDNLNIKGNINLLGSN